MAKRSLVIVESPTYDRTLLNLRNRGADLHAVDLHTDGIDTEALAALIEGGVSPKLAHVIPNAHNPAGCTLSVEKRRRLVELAGQINEGMPDWVVARLADLLNDRERAAIDQKAAALRAARDGTEQQAIVAASAALEAVTAEFAARRMDRSVARALTGRSIDALAP